MITAIWMALLSALLLTIALCIHFYRESRRVVSMEDDTVFQRNCSVYGLSAREVEVLRLLLQGKTYRQTAGILFISSKTVDGHVQRIYSKVGVRNKLELMQKMYKE